MTSVGKKHVFSEVTDAAQEEGEDVGAKWTELTRAASTNIFYLLSEGRSWGRFHRNKGRWVFFFSPSFSLQRVGGILLSLFFELWLILDSTVHTLHKGRARYVIIHADEVFNGIRPKGEARIETYVVGQDVVAGEQLQWVVEGGKYKASFLLPDEEDGKESRDGCLISEVSDANPVVLFSLLFACPVFFFLVIG